MGISIDWKIINIYCDGLVYLTEGAAQYCGHEIELNLSVEPNQAKELINTAVARCKHEQKMITEETIITLFTRDVTFRKMLSIYDEELYVWRMVLPDRKGRLPEELDCHPVYRKQIALNKKASELLPIVEL